MKNEDSLRNEMWKDLWSLQEVSPAPQQSERSIARLAQRCFSDVLI